MINCLLFLEYFSAFFLLSFLSLCQPLCYQLFQGMFKISGKVKLKQFFLNPVVLEAMQYIHCICIYKTKALV